MENLKRTIRQMQRDSCKEACGSRGGGRLQESSTGGGGGVRQERLYARSSQLPASQVQRLPGSSPFCNHPKQISPATPHFLLSLSPALAVSLSPAACALRQLQKFTQITQTQNELRQLRGEGRRRGKRSSSCRGASAEKTGSRRSR